MNIDINRSWGYTFTNDFINSLTQAGKHDECLKIMMKAREGVSPKQNEQSCLQSVDQFSKDLHFMQAINRKVYKKEPSGLLVPMTDAIAENKASINQDRLISKHAAIGTRKTALNNLHKDEVNAPTDDLIKYMKLMERGNNQQKRA